MESSSCSCRLKRPPSQIKTCALTKSSRGGASFWLKCSPGVSQLAELGIPYTESASRMVGWFESKGLSAGHFSLPLLDWQQLPEQGPAWWMWTIIALKVLSISLHDRLFFLMTFRIEAAIQRRVSFMPLVPVAVFVEEDFFYGKNASKPRQCPGMGSQVGNVLPPIWTTCTTFASWVMFKVQIIGILEEIDSFYWPKNALTKRVKNLGRALPPHLDKIQKNSYFFSWSLP